jgi:hypothetical protein
VFGRISCISVPLYTVPDDDLVQVETIRRAISDKLLFVIDCAMCCVKTV